MASHPPAECCAVGTLFAGTPSGESIKIDDGRVEAYVAKATGSRARKGCGILYLPDVIGIWQNSKLIADGFAASGYTTLVVDLFDGDAVPPNPPKGFQFFDWLERGTDGRRPHTAEHVDPIVVKGVKALRELGVDKIAAVGYCFGAKYVVRHLKDAIDVGFVAHPSFVEEDELAAIGGPLSIAAAETDQIFPPEKRRRSEEILAKTGQPYQMTLYSGVSHGFAVRGKQEVRVQRFAKREAFRQAVTWFDEFLDADGGDRRSRRHSLL